MAWLCWCQIPLYFMVLWSCRDQSLFLDDNTEVLRGEVAWCLHLTFKWFRKKKPSMCVYSYLHMRGDTEQKWQNVHNWSIRWEVYGYTLTTLTTLSLNLKLSIKKAGEGVGGEKHSSWLSSGYSYGSQKTEMLRDDVDKARALGLTSHPLPGYASCEWCASPGGAFLVWNGSRYFDGPTRRHSSYFSIPTDFT